MSLGVPVEQFGLDPRRIELHQKRVSQAIQGEGIPRIRVLDTCRLDNHGILKLDDLKPFGLEGDHDGFVGFIPSAGASSRYFAPLARFEWAMEEGHWDEATACLESLKDMGAGEWYLPEGLQQFINNPLALKKFQPDDLDRFRALMKVPKALMPCTSSGESFLYLKRREHQAIGLLQGEVYVIPPQYEQEVEHHLAQFQKDEFSLRVELLQQGPSLSTIRFDEQGQPLLEKDGQPSIVPAGHGALVQLFPQVKDKFPKAHSLFIRNIDNIMGAGREAVQTTRQFLGAHNQVLSHVQKIRDYFAQKAPLEEALACANALLQVVGGGKEVPHALKDPSLTPFWQVQWQLFQMDPRLIEEVCTDCESERASLTYLFSRPVNTMGQVPNRGSDVGGTPVFASIDGAPVKLCLEVPHASEQDRKKFLEDSTKATHFNPVFVASELPSSHQYYDNLHRGLWLLAKKSYMEKPVFYHETVLYEVLGTNRHSNLLFVEVPRVVFNPHKTLMDGQKKCLSDWLTH